MNRRMPEGRSLYPAAFAIFILCAIALASPWITGRFTIPWDAKAHFYPQIVFLAKSLNGGESPFWNPYVFAGSLHIADPQSLIFTLPYLLLARFMREPGFIAADATVFVMLALGGLALMAWFRDRDWHPAGALVAALAFAFGGSAAWRIQHVGQVLSLAFFAIALFFLARIFQRGRWHEGICAGFFGALMLVGRDQVGLLCAVVLVIFALSQMVTTPWRQYGTALAVAVCAGIIFIALPIAFTLALAEDSNRVLIDYAGASRGSLHPASLFTVVVANLYGTDGPLSAFWGPPVQAVWGGNYNLARNMANIYFGALPFVALVGMGLFAGVSLRSRMGPFLLAFALMLLYALGDFTPFFQYAFSLPGADLFRRPADATFPLGALAAILAGYAVHRLAIGEVSLARRFVVPLVIAICVFLGALAIAYWKGKLGQALWPLVTGAACLAISVALLAILPRLTRQGGYVALLAIGIVVTADLAINNGPNESTALPPSHYDVMRTDTSNETIALLRKRLSETAGPDRIDRVELAAVGFDWPNLGMIHGFHHDLGYNPIRFSLFAQATGAQDHVAIPEQRHFAPLFPSYRSLLADMLGLRFIASGVPLRDIDKKLRPGDLIEIGRTKDAYIYENPRALPRVLFVTRALKADFEDILQTGRWPQGFDPRQTILLEEAETSQVARRRGSARILAYENTQVRVGVDAPDGGWLVLNDMWHPWWRVEIDGVPATLLQANVLFRAVAVPAGARNIRFYFAPFSGLASTMRDKLTDP
jgi:hypothetical protein